MHGGIESSPKRLALLAILWEASYYTSQLQAAAAFSELMRIRALRHQWGCYWKSQSKSCIPYQAFFVNNYKIRDSKCNDAVHTSKKLYTSVCVTLSGFSRFSLL